MRPRPTPTSTVHWGDAMQIDLAALRPAPNKVVANLPYGIAASALLRTIAGAGRGEPVGGDGAAGGRRAAGCGARQPRLRRARPCSPSSSARCGCCGPIPRTVFLPVPNVDSVLVAHAPAPDPSRAEPGDREPAPARARERGLRPPAQDAGRIAGPRRRRPGGARASRCARRCRSSAIHPTPRRAALPRGLPRRWPGCSLHDRRAAGAGAGQDQPRPVPGPRQGVATRRHELVTVMQSISLADELTLEPAPDGRR